MFDEYRKLLKAFISFKTISSDPANKGNGEKAAEWLVHLLQHYGFTAKQMSSKGNPFVFGSFPADPEVPTVLIYGHYDVQPARLEEGWETDPFTLTEKDEKLFARGVGDDKGQLLLHLVTVGNLIKEGKLAYNVKFLFEGDEENGSPYIYEFVNDNKHDLSCDLVLLSDGEMIMGKPTIELGNRGILNFTLRVQTADNELHSGIYGGAAPNAAHELVRFISNLWDSNNRLTIEGLYDNVDPLDTKIGTPFSLEEYKKNTGTKELIMEKGFDFHSATGQRPALSVISLEAGYRGEGYKTTIPPVATAKFNFRLVNSQDPHKIADLIRRHIEKVMPRYVTYTVTFDEFAKPNKTNTHNPYIEKTEKLLERICGEKVVRKYVGGTEPAISCFSDILQKPIVSVPFANEDGHMHGVNENFVIKNIERGLEFSREFFSLSSQS